jgi:glutamate dehydrogenase
MSYLQDLESQKVVNRAVEFLPSSKELAERKAAGYGLTRPELAVLLAYTKIAIKKEVLKSDLTDDPYLRQLQETAFPPAVRNQYKSNMNDHRLAKDIVATQISNRIINEMGITFVYRLQMETGATASEIIRAHTVASQIFNKSELQKLILSLDYKISMADQYNMLFHVRNLINLATRWFLHGNHLKQNLKDIIDHYTPRVKQLEKMVPTLMSGITSNYMETLINDFMKAGLPRDIALRIATYRAIYTSLNIIEVATKHDFDLESTAIVYFHGGARMNLVWYRDQINTDSREGHWNTLARLALRDELDISQRALTLAIMKSQPKEKDPMKLIDIWTNKNQRALERWERITTMLTTSSNLEYTMFFIAIRELVGLVMASID